MPRAVTTTSRDPRIDAYIERAAPFAQPILARLREQVHAACPEVEEGIKWGMPSFVYGGKILCNMAAFKQHASFGFWQGARIVAPGDDGKAGEAMGQFGRITKLSDLPGKRELAGYVKQAMALIDAGVTRSTGKAPAKARPEAEVPADLAAALKRHRAAAATFVGFPPSQRRDYIEWIVEAKRDDTRQRRIHQAVEWLAEGKPRNWKYMKA